MSVLTASYSGSWKCDTVQKQINIKVEMNVVLCRIMKYVILQLVVLNTAPYGL